MKQAPPFDDGGDEGEEDNLLPFGRPSENQSSRRRESDDAFKRAGFTDQRRACLAIIRRNPSTCDEIEQLGWPHQSASAALNWLMRHGMIKDSKRRRKTRHNRTAIVWEYCPNPIPIPQNRATRRQLADRVAAAIEYIDRGNIDPTHLRRILSGEPK